MVSIRFTSLLDSAAKVPVMEMVFSELRPHRGSPVAAMPPGGAYQRLYQLDWQNLRQRLAMAGELVRTLSAGRTDGCASFSRSAARVIAAIQPEDVTVNQMCSTIGKSLACKSAPTSGEGSPLRVGPNKSNIFE